MREADVIYCMDIMNECHSIILQLVNDKHPILEKIRIAQEKIEGREKSANELLEMYIKMDADARDKRLNVDKSAIYKRGYNDAIVDRDMGKEIEYLL